MADHKYYWIKLKDTMFTSDAIDFLMGQPNGANYVVLYQMLCLKTANTNGEFYRQIGEVIIPYDIDKIQRDCKYFDRDTIIVALELYKKLNLIYTNENGNLQIANFDNLVGSEWTSAERMRLLREKQKASQCDKSVTPNVTQDNRYKILENRDKNIDNKDKKENINVKEDCRNDAVSPSDKKPAKHKYGKFNNILLTDDEHIKLLELDKGVEAIEWLSEYREMKGYKAKSDYLAIRKWVFTAMKEEEQKRKAVEKKDEKKGFDSIEEMMKFMDTL